MNQPSEQSNNKPAFSCFELDPLNTGHPARSRVCNGWETICCALEEIPVNERALIILELERRMNEKGLELLRTLTREQRARRGSR
jgi:hypothetical protein